MPPSLLLDEYLLNADQWDGYNADRKDLMAFVRDTGVRNLVALTGDIHAFFAGSVMDDYDAAAPEPVMVDLVTAGISSNSFFSYFKNVVDTDPSFAPARPLVYTEPDGAVLNTFNNTLKQFNGDWLRYADTDAQGFAVVTLTPGELRCVFNKLKPLAGNQAPALPAVATQTVLTVASGSPAVTVAG
ncbi:PhoD-like phosphatase [compost metagenome]